ncbi:flavin monoamine oxidase family protein [Comamonas testosteroni]|uniref:flavin monoamine oxidase family protein n=1 Tax=Comamonas testosteroni TaxID=285 RepID=UPI00389A0DD4
MKEASVVIVGAGLSGLYAAYLLEKQGIHDYVILEARSRLGGRLLSETSGEARFDLGATWYWPEMQPKLDDVVKELGLRTFQQHESGMVVVEQTPSTPARRFNGMYAESPQSLRIEGGMASMVERLAEFVPGEKILSSHRVIRIDQAEKSTALVEAMGADEVLYRIRTSHVLLALPPRLVIDSIEFQPPLPTLLARDWAECPTWMAPHAKYVAVYPQPFWREQGLSGSGRSYSGPMVEIHDASPAHGQGAIFGFIGVPASARKKVSPDELIGLCRAQMARLFGIEALTPTVDWLKDWSQDEFTATTADVNFGGGHASAPASTPRNDSWEGRVTGIASEWSIEYSGYVAGAIDAAARGLAPLLARRRVTASAGS